MLFVITSDSHGRNDTLKAIASRYPQADLFLDAGDSECREDEILPFLSVRGNRDYLIENRYRIEEMNGCRIFLYHGDRSILSKEFLCSVARNNNCQIIIHGHTHVPFYTCYQGIHILNPGSVTFPRSRQGATYALLTIDEAGVKVEFQKVDS
ncbi:MAG: YfcE family phosphodiesterase [Acholeplasmataceae bacterium]|jgi:putative phosphoesterase|nr:YfcE family phosphodiesterase [Acholeplasmataceae bacterium]